MAYEELKQKQRVMWGNGPTQRVTETLDEIHADVIRRLAGTDDRSLDLACGTGAIAGRGAEGGRARYSSCSFSRTGREPIQKAMDQLDFPWRPLGTLLVGEGLVSAADLENALSEQRRTGRLLGQILVASGSVTGVSLAQALARQHGVELLHMAEAEPDPQPAENRVPSATAGAPPQSWRPLGRLLVDSGFVTSIALRQALIEQEKRPDRRLGEILVDRGHLSGQALAFALAEQHGVDLDEEDVLVADVQTTVTPTTSDQPTYQVWDVVYEPVYRRVSVLYETTNFLEAADYACDVVDRRRPDGLEIQRIDGNEVETVWTHSEKRADAAATASKSLVETFGFDPTRWDAKL